MPRQLPTRNLSVNFYRSLRERVLFHPCDKNPPRRIARMGRPHWCEIKDAPPAESAGSGAASFSDQLKKRRFNARITRLARRAAV